MPTQVGTKGIPSWTVRIKPSPIKRVEITKQGNTLLHYAKEMIELEKKARLAIDDVLNVKKGEIKLGSSTIPGAYILLPLIQKFN